MDDFYADLRRRAGMLPTQPPAYADDEPPPTPEEIEADRRMEQERHMEQQIARRFTAEGFHVHRVMVNIDDIEVEISIALEDSSITVGELAKLAAAGLVTPETVVVSQAGSINLDTTFQRQQDVTPVSS
jgi:hypothetical protein